MIKYASELLSAFIEEERRKVAAMPMSHMPTLGTAYEEITKRGIDQAFSIPKQLNLKVVAGFIECDGETLPQQIDCMLVEGNGKRYGLTDQYFYPIEQVLCIFEVKKNLTKADLSDAVKHLAQVKQSFARALDKKISQGNWKPDMRRASKTFAQITGKFAPADLSAMCDFPDHERILLHTLTTEQLAPATIIHGHEGHSTESGLREALVKILEHELLTDGGCSLGVPALPSLVTSSRFCLVKTNGLPYIAATGNNEWACMASTRCNPARLILEVIWSIISQRLGVRFDYGDDLEMESIEPLLIATPAVESGIGGWKFRALVRKEKSLSKVDFVEWSPCRVGAAGVSLFFQLSASGGCLVLDSALSDYLMAKHKVQLADALNELLHSMCFAKQDGVLRALFPATHLLIDGDSDGGWISHERDKFDAWCKLRDLPRNFVNLVIIEP